VSCWVVILINKIGWIASITPPTRLHTTATNTINTGKVNGGEAPSVAQAYHLLAPILGNKAASWLFGVALLASGQNSTLTGTLAGQIVMEGFVQVRLRPWLRRLGTRLLVVVPAVVTVAVAGQEGVDTLLVLSQVVLSLQLPFAVVPLVAFTSDLQVMGPHFVNGPLTRAFGWAVAGLITLLNAWLVVATVMQGGGNVAT
jgi:manganese transport protein